MLRVVEENAYKELLQKHESELLVQDVPDEECRMKNAKVLESWMEEVIHESIELDFGVLPGDLSSIRDSAERILYAMKRILADDGALISKDISAHGVLIEAIDETHQRVRNGCKADLLSLVSIKNVGRKRARQMVNNLGVSDIKDVASLTERDMQKLADLQGWKIQYLPFSRPKYMCLPGAWYRVHGQFEEPFLYLWHAHFLHVGMVRQLSLIHI